MKRETLSPEQLNRLREIDKIYQQKKRKIYAENKKEEIYEYRKKNPKKILAHMAVYRALKKGLLVKCPCEICEEKKVHAHHNDYSEPLKVRWLCASHHKKEHITN